ncbi:MAG: hypothetical protein O3A00_09440 [Planctomycetota bacterium]|nr:hypothetical protein [Planctomycetota bacterium]
MAAGIRVTIRSSGSNPREYFVDVESLNDFSGVVQVTCATGNGTVLNPNVYVTPFQPAEARVLAAQVHHENAAQRVMTINANANANANGAGVQDSDSVTLPQATFELEIFESGTGNPGNQTYTIQLTPVGGFQGIVNLSTAAANATVTPPQVYVGSGGMNMAQCVVGSVTAAQMLTVTGTFSSNQGALSVSDSINLIAANLSVELQSGIPFITGGETLHITVQGSNGFVGVVALECITNNGTVFDQSLVLPINGSATTICLAAMVTTQQELKIRATPANGLPAVTESILLKPAVFNVEIQEDSVLAGEIVTIDVLSDGFFQGLVTLSLPNGGGTLVDQAVYITPTIPGSTTCETNESNDDYILTVRGTYQGLLPDEDQVSVISGMMPNVGFDQIAGKKNKKQKLNPK